MQCKIATPLAVIYLSIIPATESILKALKCPWNADKLCNEFCGNNFILQNFCFTDAVNNNPWLLRTGVISCSIAHFCQHFWACIGDAFFMLCSFILLNPVIQFRELVKKKDFGSIEEVLEYYEQLKILSIKLNELLGFFTFVACICGLPALIQDMGGLTNNKIGIVGFIMPLWYFMTFIIFFVAAVAIDKNVGQYNYIIWNFVSFFKYLFLVKFAF